MKLFKYVALLVMIVAGAYTYCRDLTPAEQLKAKTLSTFLSRKIVNLKRNPEQVVSQAQRKNIESIVSKLKEVGASDPEIIKQAEQLENEIHAITSLPGVTERQEIEKEKKEEILQAQIDAKNAFDKEQNAFMVLMETIANDTKPFKKTQQKKYEDLAIALVKKMFNVLPADVSKYSDRLTDLVRIIKTKYKQAIDTQATRAQNALKQQIGWWPIDTSKEQKSFNDRIDTIANDVRQKYVGQQDVLSGQQSQGQENKSKELIAFESKKKEFMDLMPVIAQDANARRQKLSEYAQQAIELVRQMLSLIPQSDRTIDTLQRLAVSIKDDYKEAVDAQEQARVSQHAMAGSLIGPKVRNTSKQQNAFNDKVDAIVDSLALRVVSDQIFPQAELPELQKPDDVQDQEGQKEVVAGAPVDKSPQLPRVPDVPVGEKENKQPAEQGPVAQDPAQKELDEGAQQLPITGDKQDNEKLASVMKAIATSNSFADDVLKQYENNVIAVVRNIAVATPDQRKQEVVRDVKKDYVKALETFAQNEVKGNWFGGPREMDTEQKRFDERVDKIFAGQDPKSVKIDNVMMQDELESLSYQQFFDKFYDHVTNLSKNSNWDSDKKQPVQLWTQQFIQFYKTNHELPLRDTIKKNAKESIEQMRINNNMTGPGSATLEDTVWDDLVSQAKK